MVTKKKTTKKKAVVVAPEEHRFWVCNGNVLSTIEDLQNALKTMSNDHYAYHANADKNDFASWVSDILQDSVLADALRKSKTRTGALRKVQAQLKN